MSLLESTRLALLANELSGNAHAAYRLANASKKSGLSFGATQLDISHNSSAVACLQECGFNPEEIQQMKNKGGDLAAFNLRLAAHSEIIDRYDTAQIKYCLDHVMTVAKTRGIDFANDEAVIHLADYHNQFYLSTVGKMSNALVNLGRPVTSRDILNVILDTAYAKESKDNREDVERRYNNIARLMGGNTAQVA